MQARFKSAARTKKRKEDSIRSAAGIEMARGSKKRKEKEEEEEGRPEVRQRRRLKSLAISNNLVSEVPAQPRAPLLTPSEAVVKCHGRDIVKKSQRKNLRFLLSLPGLLATPSGGGGGGGKMGELKDLGTNNPVLYLDFPEGRVKLFGTIVFPTNRYLTMHFPSSKSSKPSKGGATSVLCDDCFDNMIVFSDAWWIGTKDHNPEETQLEFPKDFTPLHAAEYDFKGGGAGSASVNKQSDHKDATTTYVQEPPSPNGKVEDTLSDQGNTGLTAATPVRHSARTAGKRFDFGEAYSGDDSGDDYVESDA